jgi:sugar/nucleoside kinase (ribokinase family)
MKDLQLFGIGAAIVDIQLQIEHDEFQALGLQKGTMNLVDAHRQTELLKHFQQYEPNWCSGGSAANTVIGFAQFGGKAALGSMLGRDNMGMFYADEFKSLGIELHAPVVDGESTGTSLILITPDTERTMNTALAVNADYGAEHVPEEAIARAKWLYFEGFKFTEQKGIEAIERAVFFAKKHGTRVAISFSDTFVVNIFGDTLRRVLPDSDLIFANLSEAQAFTGAESPDDVFAELIRSCNNNVAMTLSGDGSRIWWNGETYIIPPSVATPVDATGAGDMYASGVLYGLANGFPPDIAGRFGSEAAARVISRLGARLPQVEITAAKESIVAMLNER